MTQYAKLDIDRNSRTVGDDRTVHRAGIIGPVLAIVAAAAVVLVMVAEPRLTAEQRLGVVVARGAGLEPARPESKSGALPLGDPRSMLGGSASRGSLYGEPGRS